jgi:hypothetical protein
MEFMGVGSRDIIRIRMPVRAIKQSATIEADVDPFLFHLPTIPALAIPNAGTRRVGAISP